jgi:phenylpropionate dioxygenase-like ring-hydroxylating dioxygenase large terminal subunit
MGEEAVILCRDRAQKIHVFLNSCRHCRMKVYRYDEGNTAVLTCPYHGWSYSTDGKLVGCPTSGGRLGVRSASLLAHPAKA